MEVYAILASCRPSRAAILVAAMSIVSLVLSGSVPSLSFVHGTDIVSANWMSVYGINLDKMLSINPAADTFCATINRRVGLIYAGINPAQGVPALLHFTLSGEYLKSVFGVHPPVVIENVFDQGLEFSPGTFSTISRCWKNVSVENVENIKIDFDEE